MQPTLPQTAGTADMDLTAVQSMDWFFKKEQIYLLAQFWQQRATLAEKEVNTLKEQLSTTDGTTASTENESNGDLACGNNTNEANTENTALSDIPPNSKLLNSVAAAITLHQNGGNLLATTPSPSPPHSESGVAQNQEQQQQLNGCLNPKLFFNHAQQVMMMEAAAAAAAAAVQQQHSPMHSPQSNNGNHEQDLQQQQQQQQQPTNNNNNISNNNNNNTSKTMNCSDRTTTTTTQDKSHETSNTATESDTQCIKDNDTINNENEQDEVAREEDKDKSRINTSKEEADTANNTNSSSNNNTSLTQQCIDNISDNSFNCSSSSDSNIKNSLNSSKNTTSASTTSITATFNQNLKDSESLSTTLLQQQLQQQPPPNLHDSRIEQQSHALELHEQRGSEKNNTLNYHMELLAAKNKEIKTLFEEVKRLRAIEQNHLVQIHRLEEHLEAKRQHIIRLEAKLDKQQINEALQESQQALLHKTNKSQTLETMEIEDDDEEEQQVDDEPVEIVNPKTTVDQTQVAEQSTKAHSQTAHIVHNEEIADDDDDEPKQNVDQHTENSNAAAAAAASTENCDANENKENESDKQNSKEDYLNTNIAENLKEIKIKKETQSPLSLDSISQQNAIAAAAAAAAACNNDPNKFQELLLERTKALAAEALKNSEDPYHHHSSAHHLHHSMHNHHQMAAEHHHLAEKTLTHPESNAITASSMQESSGSRNTSDDLNASINGSTSSKANNIEDNNNSLSATPTGHMPGHPAHLPHGFLPSLPFQFQDRGHFRFADDLQLPPGTSMAGRLGESLIPKGDPMEAKLQEMLRYNMDKYANQALDTLHISRRVRELLSVHNIGQRIFAKYVLGLSQGTVSELLSKPKPWDKLTEKGRDSYRKMHAWSCDDNAVILLKSLIPKKDSGLPPFGGREESMSDERLAHILNEASSLMKSTSSLSQSFKDDLMQRRSSALNNTEDTHSNDDSKSPPPQALSPSPFFKDQSKLQNESIQKPEEMNPEKMARFYQEIMSRAPREAFPGFLLNPFFSGPMPAGMVANPAAFPGLAAAGGDENMRLAFEREMSKLQQHQQNQPPNFANLSSLMALQQQMITGAQDLTLGKDDAAALSKEIKLNGQSNNSLHGSNNSLHTLGHSTPNAKENSSSTAADVDRLYPGLVKTEQGSKTPAPLASSNASTANTNSAAPSPLSNSILPPAMTPSDDFSAVASPLQRMASITNSLITQPPVPPHHTPPQRPTKAVLPPITQQQFDMFNNLNTEDIVRRVKEALSQYSISQRLFGESVLGLSQGSVSDLLARPKPWHMLTQKGREPFIRMKMFLEDENAVHKLVASQYKIAPEKLMRTGNFNGPPQLPQGLASKMQASLPMQKMMNDLKLNEPAHIMQQMQAAAVMSAAMQQHQHQAAQAAAVQQSQQQHAAQAAAQAAQAAQAAAAQAAQAAQQHHQSMLLTSPGLPPQHAIALPSAGGANSQPSSGSNTPAGPTPDKKPMMMPIHSPHQSNAMRNMHQHMSPTVYEMAALTQDLDTQVITTKIKEALLTNNIGQKIFGEAVLGLSQGSVSELLSKPKPWHMLSIKGREPFIRMQLWLSDANNVERLQMLKNERREASKRRRSTGPNQQDNSSDTSSNDTNDFYTSSPGPGSVGSQGAPPNKKQRVLFSEEQKEALRLAFALDPYPNVGTIEFLANELGLATRTITNWFHNHRMRLKQQVPHGPPGQETQIPTRENTNSTPFDPVQFRILLQQRLLELHKERLGLGGNPALPYPPYFAAAALLGRSLAGMPGAPGAPGAPTEADLRAFNLAIREQMSGLDLTMNAFKRERSDDFDDDGDDGHLSANDNDSINGDDSVSGKFDNSSLNALNQHFLNNLRSNRRKPAAPQWVNPASGPVGAGDNERLANGENEENLQHEDDKTNEPDDLEHEPLQASYMEPEVVIKQEKEDCDSDSENKPQDSSAAAVTIGQDERLKVLQEDKLRMVRVNRLSHEDDIESAAPASAMSAGWNY